MNQGNPAAPSSSSLDALASRIVQRLDAGAADISPDISERLRFARQQALERRKAALAQRTPHAQEVQTPLLAPVVRPALTGWRLWLQRWGMVGAPAFAMLALVIGMVSIQQWQDESLAAEVAEVDAALLLDELPPSAYADPGFMQYLKTSDLAIH